MEPQHAAIARLFHPRNVVLVGASDRPDHWSRRVWDNLKRFGFAGRIMPVNPNRSEIWGVPCFPDVTALPEAPDHLVLFTPAETSLRVLRDGAAAGAQSATLYAAGFGEGRNVAIEYRWADEKYDRLRELATELVRLDVDVIYAVAMSAALAAKRATSTIPVVFAGLGDPVSIGVVSGLARPEGNLTGG